METSETFDDISDVIDPYVMVVERVAIVGDLAIVVESGALLPHCG
jgi:hypothetical protein